MTKLYSCDRCRSTIPDEDEERKEWTAIGLAKVRTPTVPFQKMDLCPTCTQELRRFLAAPASAPTNTVRCTCITTGPSNCPVHGNGVS